MVNNLVHGPALVVVSFSVELPGLRPRPFFEDILLRILWSNHPLSRTASLLPSWAHPEARYWEPVWRRVRDCMLGDQEIKERREDYLPRLNRMDDLAYNDYLSMASFVNMTGHTVNAMVGTLFQRKPKVSNLPRKLEGKFEKITQNGTRFSSLLVDSAEGILTTGRYGLLLDMDAAGEYPPYIAGYEAENIIDWQVEVVEGRHEPVQIVLREFEEIPARNIGTRREWKIIYRVLVLEQIAGEYIYRQYIYALDGIDVDLDKAAPIVVTPTHNGKPFNRIPFRFVGAKANTPTCDNPPLGNIAALNLQHYRASAILEHGRFYTGMPVWYVQRHPSSPEGEYYLGSSVVWETAVGEKPGIIEFNGTGLKSLENSCQQKEDQIAMLGGRLMGNGRSISESDNQSKLKEGNERSLLLQVAVNIGAAFTDIVNLWAAWLDVPDAGIEVELNTDFLTDMLGARELRAAHSMYVEGILPIEALHNYLMKAEVVPEWMEIDEFKKLLNTVDSFPNQPDVWAKMMGYSSNQERISKLLKQRELRVEEELVEVEWAKLSQAEQAAEWEREAGNNTPDDDADPALMDIENRKQAEVERSNKAKEEIEWAKLSEAERAAKEKEKTAAKIAAKPAPKPVAAPGARPAPAAKKPVVK